MTSLRQIEANRRNAQKSTGPQSKEGKQRAAQNAIRHGLTAETVILPLEDSEDYKAFELAISADYNGETAVERELILRLASLLWRLRRASSIETGLFQIQADIQRERRHQTQREGKGAATMAMVRLGEPAAHMPPDATGSDCGNKIYTLDNDLDTVDTTANSADVHVEVARCFCCLAELENGVFERLGRYETALWRQVRQTAFTLDALQHHGLIARHRSQLFWRRRSDVSIDRDLV